MLDSLVKVRKNKLSFDPHILAIVAMMLVLLAIYSTWPWRIWSFSSSMVHWFPWLPSLYNIALIETTYHLVGILFLVPIIYASLVFTWPGALVICLLSLARILPLVWGYSFNVVLINVVLLMLPFLLVLIVTLELQWRKKERKAFSEREDERRVYVSKVMESQEKERQRIARDLHDETIQTLLAIANNAETLVNSRNIDLTDIINNAAWIRDTTINTVDSLRRITLELRPNILDNLGLIPALRWLTDQINKECNIHSHLVVKGIEHKLPSTTEVTIYRVIQEALNNIKRHSNAKEAIINLEFRPEFLKIFIRDDGQGFSSPREIGSLANNNKLGLIGIQERINFLGGKFHIFSKPGKGTLLLIKIPL